jgi:hypothetical protein
VEVGVLRAFVAVHEIGVGMVLCSKSNVPKESLSTSDASTSVTNISGTGSMSLILAGLEASMKNKVLAIIAKSEAQQRLLP